jgi:hypothetical protein
LQVDRSEILSVFERHLEVGGAFVHIESHLEVIEAFGGGWSIWRSTRADFESRGGD